MALVVVMPCAQSPRDGGSIVDLACLSFVGLLSLISPGLAHRL